MVDAVLGSGLEAAIERLRGATPVPRKLEPLPHQLLPPWEDDWTTFVLLAGRGSGKSAAAAYHMNRLMSSRRISGRIIAPTIRDARECVVGPVGLRTINPQVRFRINEGTASWPNGSRVSLFGAFTPEDVQRLRAGTNSELDWYEELAAWVKLEECLQQASFGLRVGNRPRAIVTTTPAPRRPLKELLAEPGTVSRHATTDDNPYLPGHIRERLHRAYDGTRLGDQELGGILFDDVEGAFWSSDMIDPHRVHEAPLMTKVVIGVDPARTSENRSDETGIVVAGRLGNEAYVLDDLSGRYTPEGWAEKALWAAHTYGAGVIVAETNISGDLVKRNLDAEMQMMSNPPNVRVIGSRSRQKKAGRAQPVVALYQQKRVHHVGVLLGLEDQQYEFTGANDNSEADDRVDALTLAITELDLTFEVIPGRQWKVYE